MEASEVARVPLVQVLRVAVEEGPRGVETRPAGAVGRAGGLQRVGTHAPWAVGSPLPGHGWMEAGPRAADCWSHPCRGLELLKRHKGGGGVRCAMHRMLSVLASSCNQAELQGMEPSAPAAAQDVLAGTGAPSSPGWDVAIPFSI